MGEFILIAFIIQIFLAIANERFWDMKDPKPEGRKFFNFRNIHIIKKEGADAKA